MTLDELYLNINTVSFDTIVCQTEIKTEKDKEDWKAKGYYMFATLDEFKQKFKVDPNYIWYTNSISMFCFYFNPTTLAVCPFHIEFFIDGDNNFMTVEHQYKAIKQVEQEVEENKYQRCIMNLPDTMKLEYFKLLVEKKGKVPKLYKMFIDTYIESDYGFNSINREIFDTICSTKTLEERIEIDHKLMQFDGDAIRIYRGGNTASTPYDKAYSWTMDKNVANFFACRRGKGTGYIVEGLIDIHEVIDYLDDRNEREIVCYPENVQITSVTEIKGIEFLNFVLPEIQDIYHEHREILDDVYRYIDDSTFHDKAHSARIMLLSMIIAEMLGLPEHDKKVLAIAACYHDAGRTNDEVDTEHGAIAKDMYNEDEYKPIPIVEFLIEYHCKDDEEGYHKIRNTRGLSKQRERAFRLYKIFKDADALDRVRFGNIKGDLDLNMLRLEESKQLTLVARLLKENIKV